MCHVSWSTLNCNFHFHMKKLHFSSKRISEKISLEKTDWESKHGSRKGCVSCHTVDIVLILLTYPLTSVDLCGLLEFNPSIQIKEKYLFVPCLTYIRRSYCQGHRTRYRSIPKTRQSSQDWSKTKKNGLKRQARLICLSPPEASTFSYIWDTKDL